MNSAVYMGTVSHVRYAVKDYQFKSKLPWWLIDLDEVDELEKKFIGFKKGNFSLFSFRDEDHISLGEKNCKDNVLKWARENGLNETIKKVYLLTNLRTLGYVFNPVSFYFLEGETRRWIVIEIGNTFWEQKPTLLNSFEGDSITQSIDKLFYVSPFLSLDNKMKLNISWPKENLLIRIEDFSANGERELTAIFSGKRQEISKLTFIKLSFQFPFLCLGIISAIHWHALKIWLKGIPYFKKNSRPELQQGVFVWKSRKFVKQS